MRNPSPEPANVLWTSGWDSTYRVADLLLVQRRSVQPWYVMDSARLSTRRELKTLDAMRRALIEKDPGVSQRLLPLKTFKVEDIPADAEISAAYAGILEHGYLGIQYEWLARLAKAENVDLELSIHSEDKFTEFLGGRTVVDAQGARRASPAAQNPVFKKFLFPLLGVSKLDMQEKGAAHGFSDIQEMTWFCHTPLLDGEPCGFCNPCTFTREEGMGRRVPATTPARKMHYQVVSGVWRVRNKARWLVQQAPLRSASTFI
jgi:hypothetical protein